MTNSTLSELQKAIHKLGSPERATHSQRFFKTGPGQYAEGDVFLGLTVPEQRQIAKQFADLSLPDLQKLLRSKYHEERQIALIIIILQLKSIRKKQDKQAEKAFYDFYLAHTDYINNWDLVDGSARDIVGVYLLDKPRKILYQLAISPKLWERRIAIIATFAFIKQNDFTDTLKISEILLNDKHDLMHKAVGWMLREVGKIDRPTLDQFLRTHYQKMPRTALRYAIEHYPEAERQKFLKGLI
ncbi:DNA alkylation repair protein [Candidatus Peregrinibacteria bacterium]|nr:DNA alkylation repair protein [Candidatus Peregrinibacteria bacterium]